MKKQPREHVPYKPLHLGIPIELRLQKHITCGNVNHLEIISMIAIVKTYHPPISPQATPGKNLSELEPNKIPRKELLQRRFREGQVHCHNLTYIYTYSYYTLGVSFPVTFCLHTLFLSKFVFAKKNFNYISPQRKSNHHQKITSLVTPY